MNQAKAFGVLSAILVCLSPAHAVASMTSIANIEVQTLLDYSKGQFKEAINGFRKLRKHYKNNDEARHIEYSILLAKSQKALGLPIEACFSLRAVLDVNAVICDSKSRSLSYQVTVPSSRNHVIAAITMASLLRDLGRFDSSYKLLNAAELSANELEDEQLVAGVQVGHGNLDFVQLKLKRDRTTFRDIDIPSSEREQIETVLTQIYRRYESEFESPLWYEALSKWLSLHEEHRKWLSLLKSDKLYQEKNLHYRIILSKVTDFDPSQITQTEEAKFKLELAKHFYEFGLAKKDKNALRQAFNRSREVLATTENNELRSKAFGLIGKLYAYSEQYQEAVLAYKRASEIADNPYQWQYRQANLYEKLGDQENAITSYKASLVNLAEIEWNISPTTSEIRLNFQERTKLIYEDYLSFLLAQEQPNFIEVLRVQDQFNRALLQNYLGCSTLNTVALSELSNEPDSAIVTILRAGNKYHTIVFVGDSVVSSQVDVSEITSTIQQLNAILRDNTSTPELVVRRRFQRLYEKLLASPISNIPEGTTLLFRNLEPNLQQLPMALMHDGENYLIERYPIALIGNALYEPRMLDLDQTDILFAGISEQSQTFRSFSPLPYVEQEKINIAPETTLFNDRFTKGRFLERLQGDESIIHVASHGQFSSNPDETFLLAWDQKITLDSMSGVITDRAEQTPNPIELLVLSACQTARGDRFAALGMAGMAIQSGARSTVASLWNANDPATAFLMDQFYTNLESGMTKAEALQQAQLVTMKQPEFSNPYFWANFILLGSWL